MTHPLFGLDISEQLAINGRLLTMDCMMTLLHLPSVIADIGLDEIFHSGHELRPSQNKRVCLTRRGIGA